MTVDRDKSGNLYYQYNTSSDDARTMKGATVRLSPYEVLHIAGLGFDGLVGYSPIAMAKNAIGLAIAAEEYGSKFYANDIRELENLDRISDEEGGNLYLVNGSMTKLSDAGAFAEKNNEKEENTNGEKVLEVEKSYRRK